MHAYSHPAEQKQRYDENGSVDEMHKELRDLQMRRIAFKIIEEVSEEMREEGQLDPITDKEKRRERADTASKEAYLKAEALQVGKTIRALGQNVDLPGEILGLRELADKYADEKVQPKKTRDNFGTVVRRFIEFHGDIALEDMTLAHLRV